MKREEVGAFGHFHQERVFCALEGIVLRQLLTQSSCLHSNRRVELWIEIGGTPKNLSRNLVFLQWRTWMFDAMVGKVTEQLPQRFGTVKGMAVLDLLNLGEDEAPF